MRFTFAPTKVRARTQDTGRGSTLLPCPCGSSWNTGRPEIARHGFDVASAPRRSGVVVSTRYHARSVEDASSLLARFDALCTKVDDFAARVQASHAEEMSCRAGCDGCCRTRLTVTLLEAEAIRRVLTALAANEPQRRAYVASLAARASDPAHPRCAALDDDGRCVIYAARPLVCRSHGVPIRVRSRSRKALPVVQACALNFVARGPAAVAPGDVLDQETLSTVLFALDAALAQVRGTPAGARVDLAELLRAP
jgi:Fe-S-cluster containining protein